MGGFVTTAVGCWFPEGGVMVGRRDECAGTPPQMLSMGGKVKKIMRGGGLFVMMRSAVSREMLTITKGVTT